MKLCIELEFQFNEVREKQNTKQEKKKKKKKKEN
jgi:hypothetical protein